MFCLESNNFLGNAGGDAQKSNPIGLYLQHVELSKVNKDPNNQMPSYFNRIQVVPPKDPLPRVSGANFRSNSSSRPGQNMKETKNVFAQNAQ